jgi:hypothetical protein
MERRNKPRQLLCFSNIFLDMPKNIFITVSNQFINVPGVNGGNN